MRETLHGFEILSIQSFVIRLGNFQLRGHVKGKSTLAAIFFSCDIKKIISFVGYFLLLLLFLLLLFLLLLFLLLLFIYLFIYLFICHRNRNKVYNLRLK